MLDLSNNNGSVDFARVHKAGHRRVYLKATEGLGFVDKTYAARRAAARAAGLKVGAYHFAHPELDPRAQARLFHSVVGKLRPRDLRPCLDFETGHPNAAWAHAFIAEATRLFGVRPLIYSYSDFLHRSGFQQAPAELWLASYGRNDGREYPFEVPAPFRRAAAHQFTSNGSVPGVSGRVDVSHVFNGRAIDVPRLSARRIIRAVR